jgi:hypothetical protein
MELLPNNIPTDRSNAASAVGRRVSVSISDKDNAPSLDGLVVAFDSNANAHTIQFVNGSTKSLILNCIKFKWIVEASEASSLQGGRLARFRMTINRDAVNRKLKVFHKGRGKWFHGTIVGFSEQSGKHKIKFESLNDESERTLEKLNFRWTDVIGPRSPLAPHPTLGSGESEAGVPASSACVKAVNSKRKASCAPTHVEGKRRKAETLNVTPDRKERRPAKDCGNASRVKYGGSEMDEVAIIEIPTSSVKTKTLETKRKQANCAPTHTEAKRRKSVAHNDTDRIMEDESLDGKEHGNASLVKGGSARAKSSNTTGRASAPTFPVGTRFRKEFPGHGTFQGEILSFDGVHHKVYYSSDGDSEELSDYELDDLEITEIPTRKA